MPARSAGTARRPASCRAGRGATCPRSAASIRGWPSSTSSSTSRRLRHAADAPGARRARWLARFRIPDYAGRRAEELRKGNQQKVQFIAAILHGPDVLLMDEPFTGLDPLNLTLLREAFVELRDAGRTIVFSTHQMEAAEALCESLAIVDDGRLVAAGTLGDAEAGQPGADGSTRRRGRDDAVVARGGARRRRGPTGRRFAEVELDGTTRADVVLAAALERGAQVTRFDLAEPVARDDLHRARGPPRRRRRRRASPPAARRRASTTPDAIAAASRGRRLMARREPLLPNAGIVARREYRDRVRSPLFLASTVVLMLLALGVAMAPIAIRYLDRQSVTRIAVVAPDDQLAASAVGVTDSLLNIPPPGADTTTWQAPFSIIRANAVDAQTRLASGGAGGVMYVERLPSGQIDVRYVTDGPADGVRSQMVGFAAIAIGILDWTSTLPKDASSRRSRRRTSRPNRSTSRPMAASRSRPQELASRSFLGIVFVVLIFITVVIYGMWVATGVAAEKSSRVMELMISAASPNQLSDRQGAGDRARRPDPVRRDRHPGPGRAQRAGPDRGRDARPGLGERHPHRRAVALAAPGIRRVLPARVHAFRAHLRVDGRVRVAARRPPDPVPAAEPHRDGRLPWRPSSRCRAGPVAGSLLSFIPPFSPFVMLARVLTGNVAPWEVGLSIGAADRGHRRRRQGGGPPLRRRRAAVRPASGLPRVHRRRPPSLTVS